MRSPLLRAEGVSRVFPTGHGQVVALADVDLDVAESSIVVVRGRSGSGKTTLLNLLGGLDEPTTGSVLLGESELSAMDDRQRALVRRHEIGFVFQAFGLLPMLSAIENVEIPLRLVAAEPSERRARALELLDRVGLAMRGRHRPHELSGGEQQRVAIARSLANSPRLVLADEPTGHLDSTTGATIVGLLVELVREDGLTVVLATHDEAPVEVADAVVDLRDGRRVDRS